MKRLKSNWLAGLALLFSLFTLYQAHFNSPNSMIEAAGELHEVSTGFAPSATLFSYQGYLLDNNGAPITNPAMPMTFKLFAVATGGSACWTETHAAGNAVNVSEGRFHVLLGEIIAIPDNCLTSDAFLELTINGETLVPRELLASVAFAVEASTLPHNATTRGHLNFASGPDGEGGQLRLLAGDTGNEWVMDNRLGTFRLFHDGPIYFSIAPNGDTNIAGNLNLVGDLITTGINTPFSINTERPWAFEQRGNGSGTTTVLRSTSDNKNFRFLNADDTPIFSISAANGGGSATVHNDLHVGGNTYISGDLTVLGDCNLIASAYHPVGWNNNEQHCSSGSIMSGAYIESNLMTLEEQGSERIVRFTQGDLLCWSGENEQLEKCSVENDRQVMAVASIHGKPIVLGAELIKVIGPVEEGDYLVASNIPGYAIVNNNPAPGTVIAQALEDFNGEFGLIKAMIRKW